MVLRNAWLAFVMRCVLDGGYFGAFAHCLIGREDEDSWWCAGENGE